jgi:prepilin-type processing-associated H-X9-DG protein
MANYTIIGSDGKEYGPVAAEDLRKWTAEGRVDAQTKVRAEGSTEWMLLSQVPELGSTPGRIAPAPFPAKAPPTGKMSVMAVLSLVFGILALPTCGGLGLFGLILGIIAMVKVSNSRDQLRGKGVALAGVVVSGFSLLMVPILAAMLLPAFAAAKQKAQSIACMNNEKQLVLAVLMYSESHTNHYPAAASWCDAIKPSLGGATPDKIFQCPAADASSQCGYAFNAKLDGLDMSKVNPQTVVIFESDTGWNAHGGPEIASTQRHGNYLDVAFADGHVERVAAARLNSLRWNP